jgi:hypothetical protein
VTESPRISAEQPTKTRSSASRWLLWSLATLTLLGGAIVTLPWWLPVNWLTGQLSQRLAAQDLRLRVGNVQWGWLQPVVLSEIEFLDPDEQALVSVNAIRMQQGLLRQLLSGRDLGTIVIDGLEIDLTLLDSGNNFQKTLNALAGSKSSEKSASPPPKVDFDLIIRDLELVVWRAGGQHPLFDSGTTELSASYRAANGEAWFSLAPATVLNNIELSPELFRLGLGLIIPPVADATALSGSLSLRLEQLELPLAAPGKGQVQGELTVHRFEAAASQPLAKAIIEPIARRLQGSETGQIKLIDESMIQFELADQRMFHEGLAFGLPALDPRMIFESRGSVGIDRTLDLEMLIPVPLELLARRESVKELGIPQLTVPIRGTLDQPELDLQAVVGDLGGLLGDIGSQLKAAGEAPGLSAVLNAVGGVTNGAQAEQVAEDLGDLLRAIRERRQRRLEEQAAAAENESERDASAEPSTSESNSPGEARPGLLRRLRERRQR